MWAARPTLSHDQVKARLLSAAVPATDPRLAGWRMVNPKVSQESWGVGQVDARTAVEKAIGP